MTDEEYLKFVAWWKSQWPMSSPDRTSIEMYFKWKVENERLSG